MSQSSTEKKDPLVERLCAEEGPDRTYYALGTMLGADDFQDEQLYHRGRLARALAYLFGAGTVAGLEIAFKAGTKPGSSARAPENDELTVSAGLAIDPFGRLIEVPRHACIRLQRWFDGQDQGVLAGAVHSGKAVAWLFARYRPCERGRTPVIAEGPFDATNATAPSRLRDGYELRLFLDGAPDEPTFARKGATGADHLIPALREPLGGADSAGRIRSLQDAILAGWGRPIDMKDDAGWVLLGRVDVPTVLSGGARRYGVETLPADAPIIDNYLRPFVYGAWALALEGGLPLPAKIKNTP